MPITGLCFCWERVTRAERSYWGQLFEPTLKLGCSLSLHHIHVDAVKFTYPPPWMNTNTGSFASGCTTPSAAGTVMLRFSPSISDMVSGS